MPAATKTILYKDFDLSFRAHPKTGKLLLKKNNDSVKQGVKSLVLTNKFERPYRPDFGCDIRKRLFDLIEASTESEIESDIAFAFANYMPRADLLGVSAIADPDRNAVRVNVIFRPINSTEPVETTLILERVR
tara:strand:+ start:385 stop:783 length:399 start_codon:yes stop_codon:yes gene_type:complete